MIPPTGHSFNAHYDTWCYLPVAFDFLESEGCDYVVTMANNVRLSRRARRLMVRARRHSKRAGRTAHVYGETQYAARACTGRPSR
jgi:hypothetical protein